MWRLRSSKGRTGHSSDNGLSTATAGSSSCDECLEGLYSSSAGMRLPERADLLESVDAG
jgi:hypothetical protein